MQKLFKYRKIMQIDGVVSVTKLVKRDTQNSGAGQKCAIGIFLAIWSKLRFIGKIDPCANILETT